MATLQTYIDRAMVLTGTNSTQYIAATALEDAVVVYHRIEDYITEHVGEGYFWDVLAAGTTVISQSEYTIPTIGSGNFNGAPKVESVSIQYTAGGEFIPATIRDRSTLLQEHDLSWYEVNQSRGDPIFFIADNSVFIYPAPLEAVTSGIKFYGIKSLADPTAATTGANLFGGKIPEKYHTYISDGMKSYIRFGQGRDAEAQAFEDIFEMKILPDLANKLGNRKVGVSIRGTPNVDKYK